MDEMRIKEVFSDEAFVKQLLEQETPEAVQAMLEEKEIDFSIDEILKIRDLFEKQANGELNVEELSEDDLEDVAGGIVICGLYIVLASVAAVSVVAASGAIAGGAALTHHYTRRRW